MAARATGNEVVRWPLLSLGLPLLPLVVLLLSSLVPPQRQMLSLISDLPTTSRPFQLDGGWIGSPRIDLRAELPKDTTVVFQAELLGPGEEVLLDLSKEGWRETGTWREGGESGTYDERDAAVDLTLRPRNSGPHRLRLTLEELLDRSGRPLVAPLRVWMTVRNHSVDAPLLLFTTAVSGLMVMILWRSVYDDCRRRVVRRVEDSEAATRLWAGGDGLLRLQLVARYEGITDHGTSIAERQVRLKVEISDGHGRPRLRWSQEVPLRRHSSEGDVWWMVNRRLHVRLPDPDSYRIRATLPEHLAQGSVEVEWLTMTVADGTVQPWPVEALALQPAGA